MRSCFNELPQKLWVSNRNVMPVKTGIHLGFPLSRERQIRSKPRGIVPVVIKMIIPIAATVGMPMYIRTEAVIPISATPVGEGMGVALGLGLS